MAQLVLALYFENGLDVAVWQKNENNYEVEYLDRHDPYIKVESVDNLSSSEVFSYLAVLQNKKL